MSLTLASYNTKVQKNMNVLRALFTTDGLITGFTFVIHITSRIPSLYQLLANIVAFLSLKVPIAIGTVDPFLFFVDLVHLFTIMTYIIAGMFLVVIISLLADSTVVRYRHESLFRHVSKS